MFPDQSRTGRSAEKYGPTKRRRISSNRQLQDLLDNVFLPGESASKSLHRLQVLAFYFNWFHHLNRSVNLQSILCDLERLVSDSNPEIVGWSLVCMLGILGNIYELSPSPTPELQLLWSRIWIISSKHAELPTTCRPACAMMEAVLQKDVLEIQTILPHIRGILEYVEQRGPGGFNDNACSFWTTLFHKMQQAGITTKSYKEISLKRWIEFRWVTTDTEEKVSRSKRLVSLPVPCLFLFCDVQTIPDQLNYSSIRENCSPSSIIEHSLSSISGSLRIINFLLDDQIYEDMPASPSPDMSSQRPGNLPSTILASVFTQKCFEISSRLRSTELPCLLGAEDMGWYTSMSMLGLFLLRSILFTHSSQFVASSRSEDLFRSLEDYLHTCTNRRIYFDACLKAVHEILSLIATRPELFQPWDLGVVINSNDAFRRFASVLFELFNEVTDDDPISEIGTGFKQVTSQTTFSASQLDQDWASRDLSRSSNFIQAWRIRLLKRLGFTLLGSNGLSTWLASAMQISPSIFVLVADQVSTPLDDDEQSAADILYTFKTQVASTYDWGGNEMTMNAAMALVMCYLGLANRLNPQSHLSTAVQQLYRWIVKVVIKRELSSPQARVKAVHLLQAVSSVDVMYGGNESIDTSSGSLQIKLLHDIDLGVQFYAAETVRQTFLAYPEADRVYVYRQIVDRLETDELNSEAFAMRAYTLMQLALASDDIRRAAMVNLLELGKFESSKGRVQSCFAYLAGQLYQGDSRKLFGQNCSQFIYSWIEFEEDIFQFPYHVFGFDDFKEWSATVQSELISQLINANRWDDASAIYKETNFEDILAICLPHIVADFRLLEADSSPASDLLLERCEAALGTELFRDILNSNFALSLSFIVERLDDRTLVEDEFESHAWATFNTMQLPPLQPNYPEPPQPAFNMRKVVLAIETHRNSLQIPYQDVWSPANVVFIFRRLIDVCRQTSDKTVQKSYLRRIAFVLCVARSTILELYVLEAVLLGIARFASKVSVYREAMCIVKYLFTTGAPLLATHPNILKQVIPPLLATFQSLQDNAPDSQQFVNHECARWLLSTVKSYPCAGGDLENMRSLLEAFSNLPLTQPKTVGEIMKLLIEEDQLLWKQPVNFSFALRFLSTASVLDLESTAVLVELVGFFLHSNEPVQYDKQSKIWLGSAIGIVSKFSFVHLPEYRPLFPTIFEQRHQDTATARQSAILLGVIRFSHSHPEIAGMLEQAIRSTTATTAGEIGKAGFLEPTLKCLLSPHVSTTSWLRPRPTLPDLSDVKAWTVVKISFDEWFNKFACAIANDLGPHLFPSLIDAIDSSSSFRMAIFPLLVYEHQDRNSGSSNIVNIFNGFLSRADSVNLDFLRLIIKVILSLRERPTKSSHRVNAQILNGIDFSHAAQAAISCRMHKTSLLFLELSIDARKKKVTESDYQILSNIYRDIQDPDLIYAVSKGMNRSWDQLLDVYKLHHDREGINDLRRARLRAKVELGVEVSPEDEDLCGVANLMRNDGFPLPPITFTAKALSQSSDDSMLNGIYGSAWRLGNWDLPPLLTSGDADILLYTLIEQLVRADSAKSLFDILDLSVIRSVDRLFDGSDTDQASKINMTLRMFADLRRMYCRQRAPLETGLEWGHQILEHARFGRYSKQGVLTIQSFEAVEPQASLYSVFTRVIEKEETARRVLGISHDGAIALVIDSVLVYCQMARLCGSTNDLLAALAKIGSLEEKFSGSDHMSRVMPVVYAERAEILWSRNEKIEAVETLRTLVRSSYPTPLSFSSSPRELILANIVRLDVLLGHADRVGILDFRTTAESIR